MYTSADFAKMNQMILNTEWSDLLNSDYMDSACETFTSTYLSIVNEFISSKNVTICPNDKPWMNPQVRRAIRICDIFWILSRKTASQASLVKFKKQHCFPFCST